MNTVNERLAHRFYLYQRQCHAFSWQRDIAPKSAYWPHSSEAPPWSWMTVTRQLSDGTTYTFDVSCSVTWYRDGDERVPYVSASTIRTPRGTYRYTHGLTVREKRDYLRHVGLLDEDDRNEDDEDEG